MVYPGKSATSGELVGSARWEFCFGLALLMESDDILPQMVVDDFGRLFPGEAGIKFALEKGDSFPRADVMGVRLAKSEPDHLFMKQIDLARGLGCFARFPLESNPYCRVDAFLWADPSYRDVRLLPPLDTRAPELLRMSVRNLIGPPGSLVREEDLLTTIR